MLNLALVAILSGSLFMGGDDCKKDNTCEDDQAPVTVENTEDERGITGDTFAFGRPASSSPIKLWVEAGRGSVTELYDPSGNEVITENLPPASAVNKVIGLRVAVGTQINVINTSSFSFGVGGELGIAQNQYEGTALGDFDSGLGLQFAKIFGSVRGRVVGVHGGYIIDLADDPTDILEATSLTTDRQTALFFGADFDYPCEKFRLFGGIDYFMPRDTEVVDLQGQTVTLPGEANILLFTMGAGIRISFVELGAALILRAQEEAGRFTQTGNHHGSIAPYIKFSPPSLPVSLFVKGAVQEEYTDYGYAIGGANDIKAGFGFTAGLTIGFE